MFLKLDLLDNCGLHSGIEATRLPKEGISSVLGRDVLETSSSSSFRQLSTVQCIQPLLVIVDVAP